MAGKSKSEILNRCKNPLDELFVSIGNITLRIAPEDPDLKLYADGAKEKFLVQGVNPDVDISVAWSHLVHEPIGRKLFDSGSVWQLYRQDEFNIFRFTSLAYGSNPYKLASFNHDFSAGTVYLHKPFFPPTQSPIRSVDPICYPLDELLLVNVLARRRGAEIHACGIIDSNGHGHLFAGQSGAGKTTIARIWDGEPGVTILSDDRIILRSVGKHIWMYGTPWHGEAGFALQAAAPLTHIYFLQKGTKNELLPQGRAEGAARLFTCSFTPLYFPEAVNFTLAFFEEVVKAVPLHELRFLPDKRVIEFITSQTKSF
ncbi:MAG: hypothetical protein WCO26_09805 [Deltaproteobacteria bacterium]